MKIRRVFIRRTAREQIFYGSRPWVAYFVSTRRNPNPVVERTWQAAVRMARTPV